jgi:hypothetical protein
MSINNQQLCITYSFYHLLSSSYCFGLFLRIIFFHLFVIFLSSLINFPWPGFFAPTEQPGLLAGG